MASHGLVVACIPALNEERAIARIIIETRKYVDKIIVCDDGSTDLTSELAKKHGAEVIRNDYNLGKGATLHRLFEKVLQYDPDIVVVLDSDGQHDPADIPKLIEPIKNNVADMVVGSRYMHIKSKIPLYREFGLSIINLLYRDFVEDSVKDTQSGFRAFSNKAVRILLDSSSNGFGVEVEHLYLAKTNKLTILEVPITIQYEGILKPSNMNPILHGYELIKTIFKILMMERPLFYLGVPGVFFMIIGSLFGLDGVSVYIITGNFSMPIFLIAMGLFLLGIILFTNSVILYFISKKGP